jgi:hypothetical protein
MSALLKNIEEQARALSLEDRAKLAEIMLESLHTSITEVEAAWAEEIEERVSAFHRVEIPSCSAEEVFAEARRTLLELCSEARALCWSFQARASWRSSLLQRQRVGTGCSLSCCR